MCAAATRSLLAIALLAGSSAAAEDKKLLTPEEFLERVEGQTVHYTVDGQHYGTERFYGNGRATWQFPAASCEDGLYWPAKENICFRYGTTSCWAVFEETDSTIIATSQDGFSVAIDRIDNAPLRCDGNPIS